MHRRIAAVSIVLILLVAQGLWAKEESQTFSRPASEVFQAVKETAKQNGVIIYSDKDEMTLTFKSAGYWNKGFEVAVQVEKLGEQEARVTLKDQKTYFGMGWGAGKRIREAFFRDLRMRLAR